MTTNEALKPCSDCGGWGIFVHFNEQERSEYLCSTCNGSGTSVPEQFVTVTTKRYKLDSAASAVDRNIVLEEVMDALIDAGEGSAHEVVYAMHKQPATSAAALDVLAERRRQVEKKGYSVEHDDEHRCGEIAAYAAFYAMPPVVRDWPAGETGYGDTWGEAIIPVHWWPAKTGDRRRELVKAGALVLAEIERLDRAYAALQASNPASQDSEVAAVLDKKGFSEQRKPTL